jgi:hypothetical protein
MNNYDAVTTVAVTPVTGFYNIHSVCLDCEHEHGCSYRVEACPAILLQEAEMHGQRITHAVFAARDHRAPGLLHSVFNDDTYCGTLTEAEIEAGKADWLVTQRAETAALEEDLEDSESGS